MPYFSRKSSRLPGFNYSSTKYYFVTICTHNKQCIFGQPEKLSLFGEIARLDFESLNRHYDGVRVDVFTVMPNHVHAIIALENNGEGPSLSTVIGQYKAGVSRKSRMVDPGISVWQRSFHDHIIRNQSSYEDIWNYVRFNHLKWQDDCFFMSE